MRPCGRRRAAAEMVMDMDDHERNTPESELSENAEVCGSRRLTAEEIQFADVYPILDEGLLGFYMYWPDDFNLDEVFGWWERRLGTPMWTFMPYLTSGTSVYKIPCSSMHMS